MQRKFLKSFSIIVFIIGTVLLQRASCTQDSSRSNSDEEDADIMPMELDACCDSTQSSAEYFENETE